MGVSATNGRRNLHQLQRLGFRLLYTPEAPNNWQHGWRYALDNGAWHAHNHAAKPWDEEIFAAIKLRSCCRFHMRAGHCGHGEQSLALSLRWLPFLRKITRMLLVVQDGMTPQNVPSLPSDVGIASRWLYRVERTAS